MNIKEATERACQEPTLLDALSWICVWETERVIKQYDRNELTTSECCKGGRWETCFKVCLKSVMETYKEKNNG